MLFLFYETQVFFSIDILLTLEGFFFDLFILFVFFSIFLYFLFQLNENLLLHAFAPFFLKIFF
jgi:hypothetical protein